MLPAGAAAERSNTAPREPGTDAMHYRPDIDGLRALAVGAVVVYHADHRWLPGGFTGVDVFFVISGYLITKLIAEDLAADRFSFARFYERRARRILPALVAVMLATSLAAYAWLLPNELKRYGESLVATTLFASNIYFWTITDYFSAPPDATPLLHTWSLAVEEQFYLLFPLVVVALARVSRQSGSFVLWGMLLGSLLMAEWGAQNKPIAAFYLGPTRAWELLCGAVLALGRVPAIRHPLLGEALGVLGLASIAAGTVLLSQESTFPGVTALLPCLGAALVIHSGEHRSTLVSRLLSLRGFVFVGLISYSLYLWHWVFFVFARHLAMRELHVPELLGLIALSVLVSALSWRFIEQPFRRGSAARASAAPAPAPAASPQRVFALAAVASGALAALGVALVALEGWPGRLNAQALAFAEGQSSVWTQRAECEGLICEVGTPSPGAPRILLWGDSHAAALAPALGAVAADQAIAPIVAFKISCPPLVGYRNFGKQPIDCAPFVDDVLRFVAERNVRHVVLHARWPWYVEGTRNEQITAPHAQLAPGRYDPDANEQAFATLLGRTIDALQARGARVTIVTSVPEVGVDAPELLARHALRGAALPQVDAAQFERRTARAHAAIDAAIAARPDVEARHPSALLCRDGGCVLAHDGRALYHDDDHLSIEGARHVREALASVIGRTVYR
jgi:peptidoglycan/LPS O-acetylase OafA/YrhL